ncbi:uncharacterized protein LOC121236914 [Juglans microcarpa x Juglans regia]|uniref:uncharacterized protein LOC121236914 n=1 Tax=Juglans microcarpa x Juglans regia TaxID=2249226 RepID=UPI001B7E5FF1|nr:uncharacterized protein LOC121236914 [Juglans microcarpa x Juglans regia]
MPGVMPHDIIDLDYDLMDGEVGLNEVELNEVEGVFDSVCAFCDDGGEILCCEGRCMRSFHATVEASANMCPSLGFLLGELHGLPRLSVKTASTKSISALLAGSWALLMCSQVLRSSPVLVLHAIIFIIHIVWQNCFIGRIKLLQKSLRGILLQGIFYMPDP